MFDITLWQVLMLVRMPWMLVALAALGAAGALVWWWLG